MVHQRSLQVMVNVLTRTTSRNIGTILLMNPERIVEVMSIDLPMT
jgi:hypothetical protein